jgi:hypothetical protein
VDDTARDFDERTVLHWRHWTRRLALPLQWQDAVIRAAITLKLCQYEDTGAIVAALTTSIPEAPHSGRNWDYRYCWLRDAFFVVRALNGLAEVGTMERYLQWLYNVVRGADGGHVQPLYGIGLERACPIGRGRRPGYRGMGPVRVGNQAHEHFQHDVYGHIVLGAAQAFHDHRLFRRGNAADFARAGSCGRTGLGAARPARRRHLGAAHARPRAHLVGADVLGRLRPAGTRRALGLGERAAHWRQRAGGARADPAARLERARGAFVESLDGETLDASVLLMAEVGFLPPHDPRFVPPSGSSTRWSTACCATAPSCAATRQADDFGRPEVASPPVRSGASTRWRAWAAANRRTEAFEALLARRNAAGLLSEDGSHPAAASSGATSRRPIRWWASSTARCA